MMSANDSTVIFDDEFVNVFSFFASNNMGSGSKELDAGMATMAAEMATLKGATRAKVMTYLQEEDRKAAGTKQ
ncbi:MAG: hypothetical protein ABI599_09605 [Flavobacteriales bacterium]